MKRSLEHLLNEIESVARNPLLPRARIVNLCDEARRGTQIRYERDDPIRSAVMRAVDEFSINDDGLVMMGGEYLTTMRLVLKLGIERTPSNLARVGHSLSALGYVRLARTRLHPASRWYAPREIV